MTCQDVRREFPVPRKTGNCCGITGNFCHETGIRSEGHGCRVGARCNSSRIGMRLVGARREIRRCAVFGMKLANDRPLPIDRQGSFLLAPKGCRALERLFSCANGATYTGFRSNGSSEGWAKPPGSAGACHRAGQRPDPVGGPDDRLRVPTVAPSAWARRHRVPPLAGPMAGSERAFAHTTRDSNRSKTALTLVSATPWDRIAKNGSPERAFQSQPAARSAERGR
jgi:hypothetical protein